MFLAILHTCHKNGGQKLFRSSRLLLGDQIWSKFWRRSGMSLTPVCFRAPETRYRRFLRVYYDHKYVLYLVPLPISSPEDFRALFSRGVVQNWPLTRLLVAMPAVPNSGSKAQNRSISKSIGSWEWRWLFLCRKVVLELDCAWFRIVLTTF